MVRAGLIFDYNRAPGTYPWLKTKWIDISSSLRNYACKSETRDVPTNLGGTKNKAHTGTDK